MTFQRFKITVTSSRRHFVKINSWSYLHNRKSFLIHIYHDQGQYPSNQYQLKKRAHARMSARQCARKFLNCSKSSQIYFAYVSCHYKHFIKNRANSHFRAFSSFTAERKIITRQFVLTGYSSYLSEQFDTMFISLSLLITEWASVQYKCPYARVL